MWTPAVDATSASFSGSSSDVFSPSESSTIAEAEKKPMSTAPSSRSSAASSIVSGFPAIAPSDVWRPWPSEVPPPTGEALDRREHVLLHIARPKRGDGAVAERHDADLDRARLPLDERGSRLFRRLDPTRLEVIGAHAVRDVEGEDHRALAFGNATLGGAGQREADERKRRREDREGDVASPAAAWLDAVCTSPSVASRPMRSARSRSAHR